MNQHKLGPPNIYGGPKIKKSNPKLQPKIPRPKTLRDCISEVKLAEEWLDDLKKSCEIQYLGPGHHALMAAGAALRRIRFYLDDLEKETK